MKIQKGELEVQSVLYSPQELAPCSKLREGWAMLFLRVDCAVDRSDREEAQH